MSGGPAPVGAAAAYNGSMTPSQLLGLTPGTGSRQAAGAVMPPVSHSGNDSGAIPWHPDSPIFWLAALTVTTIAGITGASVRVRAFKRGASVNIGEA
jgi:hypothetical protein